MNLILASNSPRRKEILLNLGYHFDIVPSQYDEKISNCNYDKNLVENCAMQKALSCKKMLKKEAIIISADTVVVLNGLILGKPADKKEAFSMLQRLSSNTHFVATSICLINSASNRILKDTEITYVKFRKLSEEEIINYIENRNPLDKAGSYGIQDDGFDFAEEINGNIDNVIGFPVNLYNKILKRIQKNHTI